MWPRPPAPITTARVPAPSTGIAFLTAWIAVRPGVGERRDVLGLERRLELDHRAREVCRKSAKPPSRLMPGNEPFTQCMSSPGGTAGTARRR